MQISVVGNAAVVTSSIKVEEIKTLKAGNPQALKVFKDEEKKDEVFSISYNEGAEPSFGKFGITFNSVTRDDKKCASLTLPSPTPSRPTKRLRFTLQTNSAVRRQLIWLTLKRPFPKRRRSSPTQETSSSKLLRFLNS